MVTIKMNTGTNREHHKRWSIVIHKKETRIDDLQKFFNTKRTNEDIIKSLKSDPYIDIKTVSKAKVTK